MSVIFLGERGVVFAYDSTYAIGAGSGEWRSLENSALVGCVSTLWRVFTTEKWPVYGYKVKSHVQNDYNERVDVLAKWGAGVSLPDYPLEVCQSPRVISTSAATAAAEALYRNNSNRFHRPIDAHAFGAQTVDDVYATLLEAGREIADILRDAAPKKPPLRPYIATECLELLAERDECWKNNSKARYTELDRLIRKASAIAKCEYVETQIADHDWKGVKMCKPYRQTPHRVFEKDGNSRVLHLQRIMRLRSGTPQCFRLCLIALHSFLQRTFHVRDLVHTSYGRSEHD